MSAYVKKVNEHAQQQHAQYVAEVRKAEAISNELRRQLQELKTGSS